ncbi:SAV0927 family protein [Virgibacillus siamensis]|uniref:SAV0927 family protein n=1 Tax=Virgibacillus siamensis TaxID=480071 RepID=UPI000986F2C9|nr:SAV0927 family protein [Virgibacillus siamensis]
MDKSFDILKDETQTKEIRYISFKGNLQRYDFALMQHEEDPSKLVVIYLQKNRFAFLGKEDLDKEGEIEHVFHETEMEADEIRAFLRGVL